MQKMSRIGVLDVNRYGPPCNYCTPLFTKINVDINKIDGIMQVDFNNIQKEACMIHNRKRKWTEFLTDEDLAFVKRFALASGSLKELAQGYGVSYPTVRLRLDRLIEKIKVWDSQEITSDFEKTLRALYADGRIDMHTMNTILSSYREEMEENHESKAVDH